MPYRLYVRLGLQETWAIPLGVFADRRPLIALAPPKRTPTSLNLVGPCNKREDDKVRSLYDWYARYVHAFLGRVTENSPCRRKAIAHLNIAPNSTVLDVACGAGSNFKIIESYLRNSGTLVGIDISSESLKIAKRLVAKSNWTNVDLVNMSITECQPEMRFDAVLCTFALEIIPEYEAAIDNIFRLLRCNGRFAMLGMKPSSVVPYTGLNALVQWFWKKAAVDLERDVVEYVESRAKVDSYEECLLGFYYVLSTSGQNGCSTEALTRKRW